MENILLFIDGSVNTQSKIGFGAFLEVSSNNSDIELLRSKVKVKKFEQTSSTKLELQTLLWALNSIENSNRKILIYTDSQNIARLPFKREQLEKNNYHSKKNRLLNNADLYKIFYKITDNFSYDIIKVKGHLKTNEKNDIDKIFTLVDKISRKAMRENTINNNA